MSRASASASASSAAFSLTALLALGLLRAAAAQNNTTEAAVTITYDPATAKDAATYIVAVSALCYVGFVGVVVASWLRFRVQVLPQINLMKNVEIEHVRYARARER